MAEYTSRDQYLADLEKRGTLPKGFRVSTTSLSFFPAERSIPEPLRMNLALVRPEEPTPLFAACYTRNAFAGWPVIIGRERMDQSHLNGLLVNNKISNVNTSGGRQDAERLLERLGALTNRAAEGFIPSSTGIIGWRLPVKEMEQALPDLITSDGAATALPLAQAIMTTDSFPKVRGQAVGESGRIVGVAKGAGMIEPNMATLLVFILTDVAVPRETLRTMLQAAVESSFNRISIDGDQSTSDTVLVMSSGRTPLHDKGAFDMALTKVCADLAQDVVRNGEGTEHVVRVTVRGDVGKRHAIGLAKAVANSPLVKTAVFGNDPNVGRILMALGDYCGNNGIELDKAALSFSIGGSAVYRQGAFALDRDVEDRVSRYLTQCQLTTNTNGYPEHEKLVEIAVDIGRGATDVSVLGSDLSYGYVKENADYRS